MVLSFSIISTLKDTQYQNDVGLGHELGLAASMNVALEKQDKEANVTICGIRDFFVCCSFIP